MNQMDNVAAGTLSGTAPAEADITVNRFRRKRGQKLRAQIDRLADLLGRDIAVLDVGGRPDYWLNVGIDRISRIVLLNSSSGELDRPIPPGLPQEIFAHVTGDARNLSDHREATVDLVHSNSVIEHVGGWHNMRAMARELMRVGRAGWVQTPAWEFPVEPHYQVPFLHWVGRPLGRSLLSLSPKARVRRLDLHRRRIYIERINLLSKSEVRALFPDRPVRTEWMVLPKSYIVSWMPEAA